MFPGSTPLLPGAGAHKESVPASGAGVCGTSAIVSGTVAFESEPSSCKTRERTQHARPSVGLDRSVLHNKWEKGNHYWHCELHCPISRVLLCIALMLVSHPGQFFFSSSLRYSICGCMSLFITSAGIWAGGC